METLQTTQHSERITSGPIARTVFSLAVPVVAGMLMEFALTITDFYWVGKLGASAQDAITSSMVVQWTVFSLLTIISIGLTALISRYVGAKDLEKVRFYLRQGLWAAVALGLLITIVGYISTPPLLKLMKTSDSTLAHAVPYLRIFFLTTLVFALVETHYAIFRASGDTRTPMKVAVVAIVLNMVLDPVLIFGLGPFPRLGVSGAAIATFIAVLVAVVIIAGMMLTGKLGYTVTKPFPKRPDFRALGKIMKIGAPISTQQVVFVVVYWFLIAIVHDFGEEAGAAMGIGNRIESFSYLTCFGFSVASSTMVGQNLGAGRPDRAARCAWTSTGLAIGLTLTVSIFLLTMPYQIVSVFSDNEQVRQIAADYVFILGLSQFTMALEIVLEGSFSGAGDTMPPMIVMIPGAVARIPLAYYLAFTLDWGVNGVWWTLTITTTVKSLILAWWFALGRWKTKAV
ncbi:MATE family efflux transporter [bacterium]|nr:MATE family efflux transporter [bacterium]MCB2201993.1 MATE family efflux transporter [bacterium]